MTDMNAPDGEVALREFAIAAMSLDDASASMDEDDRSVTVTSSAHDGTDTISASHIVELVSGSDLRVTDVRANFDANALEVEVRPR